MAERLRDRTIRDFGEQWTRYTDNEGYYGSPALFDDVFGPLLSLDHVRGRRVAEIGSGTGRFVRLFLDAGAAAVVAVEPSAAMDVLTSNISDARLTPLRIRGDELPATLNLDTIFSIGVLHHIPDPQPVAAAAFNALRPGGRFAIWVYGREGNAAYLGLATPLRAITRRLPHPLLAALVRLIYWPLVGYMLASRTAPLPLAGYMRDVFSHLSPDKRRLVLYDQLNPAYAKYYSRSDVQRLLASAGFADIQLHHRHGYSWAAVATRPGPATR